MNWRLILMLSLFGLAMAILTISVIPQNVEPFCWLAIFIICAYFIAKNCTSMYFVNGLMVSIVNSVWITAAHVFFFHDYMAHHPDMAKMSMLHMMGTHPRIEMIITGPIIGVIAGLVLGLFAWIASKIVKKTPAETSNV
jgi:uncharacterized membrane protein